MFGFQPTNRHQRRISTIQQRLDRANLLEHFRIDYNGNGGLKCFVFGCRAGPSEPLFDILCHELGHVMEFGSRLVKRRTKYGMFEFKDTGKYILGHYCFEPTTTKITERECRAAAYSIAIQKALGVKKNLDVMFKHEVSSFSWLPDSGNVCGDTEKERLLWCVEYTRKFYFENCVDVDVVKDLKKLLKKVYENEHL